MDRTKTSAKEVQKTGGIPETEEGNDSEAEGEERKAECRSTAERGAGDLERARGVRPRPPLPARRASEAVGEATGSAAPANATIAMSKLGHPLRSALAYVSFADKGGDSTLSDEVLIELPEPSDQAMAILKRIT